MASLRSGKFERKHLSSIELRSAEADKGHQKEMKLLTKNPSPTNHKKTSGSARNQTKKPLWKKVFARRTVGRLSPFTSLLKRVGAGVTVEAAIVLPLCLFFLINLGSAVEMIRLHNNLQMALWDAGNRLALYGYEQAEKEAASWISGFYVKGKILDYLGESYLDASPLDAGAGSLQLWESDMLEGDRLDIRLTYSVDPTVSLTGFRAFRMANRYTVHLWNGYNLAEAAEETQIVYIAENGSVYHKDRECTHLRLAVRAVRQEAVDKERNRWGDRYSACEKCKEAFSPDILYVTEEGTKYHWRDDCAGLKRTVRSVPLAEAAEYPCCSRCGGG